MTTKTETPQLGDVIDRLIDVYFDEVAGPLPASVEVFNQTTSTVDVKPLVKQYIDGVLTELPVLRSIPIAYPQGGGFAVTWPLSVGDVVFIVPAGVSIGEWVQSGVDTPNKLERRFDLDDCVAIPGLRSLVSPLPLNAFNPAALVLSGSDIRLGSSTAADFVALASLVKSQLDTIIGAYMLHTHNGTVPEPILPIESLTPQPAPASTTTKSD